MKGACRRDVHRPVLLNEAVTFLRVVPGNIYLDGTFGLGGHTKEILKRSAPNGRVIAFDWDEEAIALGLENIGADRKRLTLIRRNFADIDIGLTEAGVTKVDGVLVDIGISSLQLEEKSRGFSFNSDEPLDMRMDQRRKLTAAQIVAEASAEELADIIFYYGEDKQARRIAAEIVRWRQIDKIVTARQLADVVARAVPRKYHPPRVHVATKVFQALRIAVNEELANLAALLRKVADHLVAGGRICVISFHSIEDRIVKRSFNENKDLAVITKKPITPEPEEIQANRRSRSARLRVAERLA